MTFRRRLQLSYIVLFSMLLLGAFVLIFIASEQYRAAEFRDRLRIEAITTARLLSEVKGLNAKLMKTIDRNTINRLHDELVLIFDAKNRLVFSSIDVAKIEFSSTLLDQIRNKGERLVEQDTLTVLGIHYVGEGKNYVVLASAEDTYGTQNAANLMRAMSISYGIGILLILITSEYFVRYTLKPLRKLSYDVGTIGPANLDKRISILNNADILSSIASSFNSMLERLQKAFNAQKYFVHFASHELKTPISIINSRIQQLSNTSATIEDYRAVINKMSEEHQKLANTLSSLLFLSSLDIAEDVSHDTETRIDTILFDAVEEFTTLFPNIHVDFNFHPPVDDDYLLSVRVNPLLIKAAILNLLNNAAKYSTTPSINCIISANADVVIIDIVNDGPVIPLEMQSAIFEPFLRIDSKPDISGQGLGLSIVRRIMDIHNGSVVYHGDETAGTNSFKLVLPRF